MALCLSLNAVEISVAGKMGLAGRPSEDTCFLFALVSMLGSCMAGRFHLFVLPTGHLDCTRGVCCSVLTDSQDGSRLCPGAPE